MITLTTLSSLNDAFVLRSMLEASEIPAFIPDENTCQMDWGYINAIGGVRVQVPEEFIEGAKAVLGEFKNNLKNDSPETIDPITRSSDATIFVEDKSARKPSEAQDPPQQTSLTGVVLVVLAFAIVAAVGFIVMRAQERGAILIEAIGAYDTGNFDLAIADYSRGIQLGSKSAQVYFDRGAAYSARGDQNKSTADYDQAIADYSKTVEIDPDFAAAYGNRGCVYLNKDECDKALMDLDKAIQFNPQDEVAYFRRGYAHQQKQEYKDAIADFDQALLLKPDDELVYTNRGFSHDERGEYDMAIADYNQALQLDPSDEYAAVNRGKAYSDKGNNDRAILDYDRALRIDPKDWQAYFNRASAYVDKGDYAKAIADYEQAILVEPDNADSYLNLAGILATCPKADLRDGKKAVELATRAFDLSGGKEPFALDALAVAYAETGDFANAVKWEGKYLESPNQKTSDLVDARKRLVLFQHRKAYHEAK